MKCGAAKSSYGPMSGPVGHTTIERRPGPDSIRQYIQYIRYSSADVPISSDRFEALGDDPDGPTPGTNAAKLLDFLRSNPDKAFTQSELAAETDVTAGSVGPTLVRLREGRPPGDLLARQRPRQ